MYPEGNIQVRLRITIAVESNKYYAFGCVCVCVCVCGCVRARAWVPKRLGVCMRVLVCSLTYPACNAYAPYCVVVCGLSGPTRFLILSHNANIFGKKDY